MVGIEPLSVGLLVTEAVGVVSVGPAVGFSLPGLVFVGRRVTDAVGVVSDGLSVEATALGLTVGFSLPGHLLAVGRSSSNRCCRSRFCRLGSFWNESRTLCWLAS